MASVWHWREDRAEELWQVAREHLVAAQLLALPTDTFYGLAAHPFQEEALARLFRLKGRKPDKAVLLLVSGADMVSALAREIPPVACELMREFWPGPLTLILPAKPDLSPRLTGHSDGVGVRQPRQEVTCRLIAALGFPVTGTSANRAGRPALTKAEQVAGEFGDDLALILEAGPCPGGLPSTIVAVNVDPPRLVRAGAVPAGKIRTIVPELVVER
jgi:L-threonylcarbamoyladenylate synthase|uniref:L-threonylcarbamoyladenylate synthase n=1 Tax=Desulfobacca acetoxidans TaxID=60893 RepID=A0A7V6A1J6_9BACT